MRVSKAVGKHFRDFSPRNGFLVSSTWKRDEEEETNQVGNDCVPSGRVYGNNVSLPARDCFFGPGLLCIFEAFGDESLCVRLPGKDHTRDRP